MADSPIAELLRQHRTDARLSQEALAERAGISARTVSDIETGVARWPRAMTVSLIAEALELPAAEREAFRNAASRRSSAGSAQGAAAGVPRSGEALVGREAEESALRALLADEAIRLVTITGGAGMGKTALALSGATDFDGRVVFIDLASVADAALVPTKVALAAGIPDVRGESVTQSFAAAFGAGASLLVLDTFEHVVAAAPFVDALLAAAPSLKVVVTSRVPLRLRAERRLPVGALKVPAKNARSTAAELSQIPSVRLLVERARHVKPDFAVTDDNAAGVVALVRAIDGVPFAIELAAPLLRVSSPAMLAGHLARPLEVLVADRPGLPPRRRTMREAIAWSYELLAPPERRMLTGLGVFRGAFTVAAAQYVTSHDVAPAGALQTLRTLAALADQSLLRVIEDSSDEPRFELPALVREYAAEDLERSGETAAAHERLARYCIAVLADAAAIYTPAGLARLDAESATFDTVLERAKSTGALETALAVAVGLREYWWIRGAFAHGYAWLRPLLDLAERGGGVDEDLIADAHWAAAGLSEGAGRYGESTHHAARALKRKRETGDRRAISSLLMGSGVGAQVEGDYVKARALMEEGLAIRRDLNDRIRVAQSLCDLGMLASIEGDFARGAERLEESLGIFREAGHELGVSAAMGNLAYLAFRSGLPDRAEVFAAEGRRLAKSVGFDDGYRVATFVLALVALRRDEDERAEALLTEAIGSIEHGTSAVPASDALRLRAGIECLRGRMREAARLLGAASTAELIAPADRAAHDALVARVSEALGDAFDAEWTIGRAGGTRAAFASFVSR